MVGGWRGGEEWEMGGRMGEETYRHGCGVRERGYGFVEGRR